MSVSQACNKLYNDLVSVNSKLTTVKYALIGTFNAEQVGSISCELPPTAIIVGYSGSTWNTSIYYVTPLWTGGKVIGFTALSRITQNIYVRYVEV